MSAAESSKKWRTENPWYREKQNRDRRNKYAEDTEHRAHVIRRGVLARYKMTPEQYEQKLQEQGGHCALCDATETRYKLHVDHDHKCCDKKFTCGKCRRGILCSECNINLAALEEILKEADVIPSPGSWTEKAMRYIDSFGLVA